MRRSRSSWSGLDRSTLPAATSRAHLIIAIERAAARSMRWSSAGARPATTSGVGISRSHPESNGTGASTFRPQRRTMRRSMAAALEASIS
jgi:hypothetical protein